jgi:glycosyltransferase involved in cell wall biosynthesis
MHAPRRRSVKILLVSHNFPPEHAAGTESYTAQLGIELARRGHSVHVYTTEKDISRPHLSLRERPYTGLTVHELYNNLHYQDFHETWDYPPIDRAFDHLLTRLTPDVVHVQHLMYLSVGCVEAAARRRIPVVYTLHDYWLQCARFGQRVHADGAICHTIDFARCGTCLARLKYAQSPLERRLGGAIARLRELTGVDVGGLARGAAATLRSRRAPPSATPSADPDPALAAHMEAQARERADALRRRLVPRVRLFLSPSAFLRERFVEWGFPPEKLRVVRTGVDARVLHSVRREPRQGALRVAFVGTYAPAKGPHLLLDAWGLLPPEARARGELDLYGPERHHAEYRRRLAEQAAEVGARLHGPLTREGVIALLCETDLIVVPSVWYENAPLVILEAIACKTPLLVADLGGMAELVEPGATGYRFKTGDAQDLAAKLAGFLERPERLDELYARGAALRSSADLATDVEAIYGEVVRAG